MSEVGICDEIRQTVGSQFVCSKQGAYTRIDTPYLYPDGDYISLFCETRDNAVTVTDLAETISWLWMQSATQQLSSKQNQLIQDTCTSHGVQFEEGMLQARCEPGKPLGEVVTRVAQAAIRVSDLWFMSRAAAGKARRSRSIVGEVAHYLTEINCTYDRDWKTDGKSGNSRTLDFRVHASQSASSNAGFSLIHVLSAGNRAGARSKCDRAVAVWYDLEHTAENRISLFDDTADIWQSGDYQLLEKLSQVARWSRQEEFARLMQNGA